jgi:hypothetical protein
VPAAFDRRDHAEQRGRRSTESDEVYAVAQPDLQSLTYLVFDGHALVAAFAMRDDAEQWIGECGNSTMELREMSARAQPVQSTRGPPDKRCAKTGAAVARKR